MSSESKKKRGESGKSKAEAEPFRLNGLPPDWMARRQGCTQTGPAPSGGSVFMRGFVGGIIAERCGYGRANASDNRMVHAASRCTHPMLREE